MTINDIDTNFSTAFSIASCSLCETDVGGVVLNLHTSYAVEKAYNDMKESVSRLASPEGFEGVTVQPMIQLKGYEIILGCLGTKKTACENLKNVNVLLMPWVIWYTDVYTSDI